jgi:hypothetical protein
MFPRIQLEPPTPARLASTLFFAVLIAAPSFGEEPGNAPAPPEKDKEAADKAPIFYLRDGSKIAGTPRLEALQITTSYGVLNIPRDQLVRIRFARRVDAATRSRIEGLIEDLGNEDFDRREAASKSLTEVGPDALQLLRKALKSSNEEVKNRATILIGQIDTKSEGKAEKDEALPELVGAEDEVTTAKMTLRGTVSGEEIGIDSRYGELKIRVADLAGAIFRASGAAAGKVEVSAQNQAPQNWVDSKLDVEKGQKLKIEAAGQITVRNYGISSGPEGNRDWGGNSFNNFPMLALVGKIGKRGQPFLIGPSFTGKANASGRLHLAVVPFTPYAGGASGSYQVKIQTAGGD